MGKATYKVSGWHTKAGKNPIGVPYRNTWLYAKLDGKNLTDCTIDKVTVHLPKMRCYFSQTAEFRMKYGGVTVKHAMGTSGDSVVERSYKMNGAKDTMFKDGSGEVVFYAYAGNDEGYLVIEDANVTVEVEYTPKASRLTVPDKTVEAGQSLHFSVLPYNEGYTHKASLTMGDKTATVDIEAGVTEGSIDVPLDWLTIIPDKTAYNDGMLKLETYKGDVLLGSETVSGISMLAPMYSLSVAHTVTRLTTVDGIAYADVGRFVQFKSGIRVNVTDAQGYYGSTVDVTVKIGDKTITGKPPMTAESGLLRDTQIVVQVSAIDSRGVTALSRPTTYMITPYTPPQAELAVWRTNEAGEADILGERGAYQCSYSHTSIGGENPLTVEMTVLGETESNPAFEGQLLPGKRMHFDPLLAYDVELTAADKFETVTKTVRLPSAAFLIHGNDYGNGAGIGHAATKQNALVINPGWEVWMGGKEMVSLINQLVDDVAMLKTK